LTVGFCLSFRVGNFGYTQRGAVPPEPAKREFNTPVREPFNAPIAQILKAIDAHTALFLRSGDWWHMQQAATLRLYVRELKDWIKRQEQAQ